jgi:hypothetical protein
MENPVSFTFQLTTPGCAQGSLSLHGNTVHFKVNNSSNPLYDLLTGLTGMISTPSHIWDELNQAWIEWFNDEYAIRIVLTTMDGEHLQVTVSKLNDIFDDSQAHTIIDGECLMVQFILSIVRELDHFIKNTGLLNYSQKWQKDEFPITSLLFLKKSLIDKGLWISNSDVNHNFSDELELLMK